MAAAGLAVGAAALPAGAGLAPWAVMAPNGVLRESRRATVRSERSVMARGSER
jgi:hypothetical protein